jgi:hypothetical protein
MPVTDDFVSKVSALLDSQRSSTPMAPVQASKYSGLYEAAAVLSFFDRGLLAGTDSTQREEELERLLADSIPVASQDGEPRWSLAPAVRVGVLRQLRETGGVEQALINRAPKPSDAIQRALQNYLLRNPVPVINQSLEDVTASYQVCQWLRDAGFEGLPEDKEFRQRADWFAFLDPYQHLVGNHFRGRTNELQELRDYVGVLPPGTILGSVKRVFEQILSLKLKPPLLLHGPGGVGKSTLLARFILDHVQALEVDRFPFIYLDFDRPDIDPREPLTLLLEALRQLGIEYPHARESCEAIARGWREQMARDRQAAANQITGVDPLARTARVQASAIVDFASLVNTLGASEQPVVLILDTFEEVQWRSEEQVAAVWDLLEKLQPAMPRLRAIVAGRANVPGRETKEIQLTELDQEAAIGYLNSRGVTDEKVAERIARQVGRTPLTLQLAADLYAREGVGVRDELDLSTHEYLFFKMDQAQIQRLLYKRVLSYIHNKEVRKLAHPGLVLRRITPDLILQVLAEPCGLVVPSLDEAQRLFKELRREVSLVSSEGTDGLRHRSDLRRLMVEPVQNTRWPRTSYISASKLIRRERLHRLAHHARA